MKTNLFGAIALLCLAFSLDAIGQAPALTAADYARAEKMLVYGVGPLVDRAGVRPNFLPDGRFWYKVLTPTGSEYVLVNPTDGSRTTGDDLVKMGVTPPARKGSGDEDAAVSPDGSREAFIRDYNLWVRDVATKKETQLTTDGVKNFGYATDNAGWTHSDRAIVAWSPDSKKIATFQQDERNVNDSYLVSTKVGAPTLSAWKSALPGDANIPMIHRVIIDVDSAKVVRLQMPPDPHRSTVCDDIACDGDLEDVYWSKDGAKLGFVSTTRDHKIATLREADAATGTVRDIYSETAATQFESTPMGQGGNWRYLPATNEFIWYSESDGWGQLYLYDLATGKLKNRITSGEFAVWNVVRVDDKARVIFFEAGGHEKGRNPYFKHFYRVGFDGKDMRLLTPEDASHNTTMSPSGGYFIDSYSTREIEPVIVLRDDQAKSIANL